MQAGTSCARSSRLRGIAALTIGVVLILSLFFGLIQCLFSWGMLGWGVLGPDGAWAIGFSGFLLVEIVIVVFLLRWLRPDGEWGNTVHRWFCRRRIAGLPLGLMLTLPIPLTILAVDAGAFAVPDMVRLIRGSTDVSIGPVAEEILFRGFLFGVLWREVKLHPLIALSLSSFLFGLGHPSPEGWLTLSGVSSTLLHGTTGALLCWVYWKREEDLWLPIGLHAGINIWLTLAFRKQDEFRSDLASGFLFAKVATLLLAYAFIRILEGRRRPDSGSCRGCRGGGHPGPSSSASGG